LKELRISDETLAKENEAITIALLAESFKARFIDPADSNPSLKATVGKAFSLLQRYFSDLKSSVQQACARTTIDLQRFCLKNNPISK
jgi:hypothetical protein